MYSSDKTLRPKANISPTIVLENSGDNQILVTNVKDIQMHQF